MTGSNPYFVKKGQVDQDGFITTVDSCLKIMNHPKDVHDLFATGDAYTYPAPDDRAERDDLTPGYYYTGDMVELVGPTPSPTLSPTLTLTLSPPPQVAQAAPTVKNTTNPTPEAAAASPAPMVQTAPMYTPREPVTVYNQDLPYATPQLQPQSRYPPAPTVLLAPAISRSLAGSAEYKPSNFGFNLPVAAAHGIPAFPYGTATLTYGIPVPAPSFVPGPRPGPDLGPALGAPLSPAAPSGGTTDLAQRYFQQPLPASNAATLPSTSVLTLDMGSKVGQPIPENLHPVIAVVRGLPHVGSSGHPERKTLKKPYEGTYESASREGQLIRDHFQSGSGLMKKESPLMDWYGDESIFEARMWEFLAVQKPRWFARSHAQGEE